MELFRTKICGVRLKEDVRAVGDAGGDAVGLNFYPPSVRFLDPDGAQASELAELARQLGIFCVGVFVNDSADQVAGVALRLGLDAVQLHGDEPQAVAECLVETLAADGVEVIRAIKLPRGPLPVSEITERCQPYSDLGCHLILDVDAGAAHGGSGKCLDWDSVARWAASRSTVSWTLAGGLKPENVAEAIERSSAVSVDTASGVECPKGVKNQGRIKAFVAAARTVG